MMIKSSCFQSRNLSRAYEQTMPASPMTPAASRRSGDALPSSSNLNQLNTADSKDHVKIIRAQAGHSNHSRKTPLNLNSLVNSRFGSSFSGRFWGRNSGTN